MEEVGRALKEVLETAVAMSSRFHVICQKQAWLSYVSRRQVCQMGPWAPAAHFASCSDHSASASYTLPAGGATIGTTASLATLHTMVRPPVYSMPVITSLHELYGMQAGILETKNEFGKKTWRKMGLEKMDRGTSSPFSLPQHNQTACKVAEWLRL